MEGGALPVRFVAGGSATSVPTAARTVAGVVIAPPGEGCAEVGRAPILCPEPPGPTASSSGPTTAVETAAAMSSGTMSLLAPADVRGGVKSTACTLCVELDGARTGFAVVGLVAEAPAGDVSVLPRSVPVPVPTSPEPPKSEPGAPKASEPELPDACRRRPNQAPTVC